MKYIFTILFLGLMFSQHGSKAQCNIPNSGFENWDSDNIELIDWFGFGTEKTSDKFSGTSALLLKNLKTELFSFPGFVATPFPCTSRSQFLTGYMKTGPGNLDTFIVSVVLFKSGLQEQPVASGSGISQVSRTSYTQFNVPITYLNQLTPDSAYVTILGMSDSLAVKFDNFAFSNTASGVRLNTPNAIKTKFASYSAMKLSVFPQPAEGESQIQIDSKIATQGHLEVYNLEGKSVRTFGTLTLLPGKNNHRFHVGDLKSGLYLLRFISPQGGVSQKFQIK